MESLLFSVIALGVFIILSAIMGISNNNSGKTFDVLKLVINSILFLLMSAIWFSSIFTLQVATNTSRLIPLVALYIVGITLVTNLIIDLTSAFIKKVNQKLIVTHAYSTFLMTLSVLTGIISLIFID